MDKTIKFIDRFIKDNKLKYDELINYILRGITENTAMYDVAEHDRKKVLQKMTEMKREIENLKRHIRNNSIEINKYNKEINNYTNETNDLKASLKKIGNIILELRRRIQKNKLECVSVVITTLGLILSNIFLIGLRHFSNLSLSRLIKFIFFSSLSLFLPVLFPIRKKTFVFL